VKGTNTRLFGGTILQTFGFLLWVATAKAQCPDPPFSQATWASDCRKYGGTVSSDGRRCIGWDTNWCHRDSNAAMDKAKKESEDKGAEQDRIEKMVEKGAEQDRIEKMVEKGAEQDRIERMVEKGAEQDRLERMVEMRALIPDLCFSGNDLQSNSFCDVVEAAGLGWTLSDAAGRREARRLITEILAEKAAGKVVCLSLEPSLSLESRIKLVQSIHAAVRSQLQYVAGRIQTAMMEDPVKARWLKTHGRLDSYEVTQLRQRVFHEQRLAAYQAAVQLQAHPSSQGIALECRRSCMQIVSAAKGVNIFDAVHP
jgi:hypothetical protein